MEEMNNIKITEDVRLMGTEISYDDAYYIFVIGYDLMHDAFKNSDDPACDVAFNKACEIWSQYLKSGFDENYTHSTYECLSEYIRENRKLYGTGV